eukprot:56715-Rhodomonas_salina.2
MMMMMKKKKKMMMMVGAEGQSKHPPGLQIEENDGHRPRQDIVPGLGGGVEVGFRLRVFISNLRRATVPSSTFFGAKPIRVSTTAMARREAHGASRRLGGLGVGVGGLTQSRTPKASKEGECLPSSLIASRKHSSACAMSRARMLLTPRSYLPDPSSVCDETCPIDGRWKPPCHRDQAHHVDMRSDTTAQLILNT